MEDEPKVIWEGKGQIIYDFRIEPTRKEKREAQEKINNLTDAWKYGLSISGASGEYESYVPSIFFIADTKEGLIRDMATYIDLGIRKIDSHFLNVPPMSPDNIRIIDDTGEFSNFNLPEIFKDAFRIAKEPPPPGEATYIIEIKENEEQPKDKRYSLDIIYVNGVLNYAEIAESDKYLHMREGVDKFSNISMPQVFEAITRYILTTAPENRIQPTQTNTKIVNYTNNPEFTLKNIASYLGAVVQQAAQPQPMPQNEVYAYPTQSAYQSGYGYPVQVPQAAYQRPRAPQPQELQEQPSPTKLQHPKPKEEKEEESDAKKDFKFYKPDYGLDSVIGMESAKKFLHDNIILGLERPDLFKKYKKSIHDGFILYGPPGTGKTYLVGALAHDANMKLLVVNIHELMDQYVGNTEKNIHEVFEQARKNAPCIILFDEIDGLGMSRNMGRENGNRSSTLALNQILTEMDGILSKNEDIITIGTTNEPQDIDTALLRSGRFTNLMYVRPPDKEVREKLFKFYTEGIPKEDMDYAKLGEESTNFSPADIKATVKAAVTPLIAEAVESGIERELTAEDLLKAIRQRRSSGSTMVKWYEDMNKILKKGGFTEEEKLEYAPMFEDMKKRIKSPRKASTKKRRLHS